MTFTDRQMIELFNKCTQRQIMTRYKLTARQCVLYLLNTEYSQCDEDTYICDNEVLIYQPHLTDKDLIDERKRQKVCIIYSV